MKLRGRDWQTEFPVIDRRDSTAGVKAGATSRGQFDVS
jgi:hypothetical protein